MVGRVSSSVVDAICSVVAAAVGVVVVGDVDVGNVGGGTVDANAVLVVLSGWMVRTDASHNPQRAGHSIWIWLHVLHK
jgi:hypothetical protein